MINSTAKGNKNGLKSQAGFKKPKSNGKGMLPVSTTICEPAWDHLARVALDDPSDPRTLASQLRKVIHDWHDGTKERPSARN